MKRLLIGFVAGVVFRVLLVLGPHPLTDSPWPAPTPSPTPAAVNLDILDRQVDRLACEAAMAQAVIAERLRLTGRPNPPPEDGPRRAR